MRKDQRNPSQKMKGNEDSLQPRHHQRDTRKKKREDQKPEGKPMRDQRQAESVSHHLLPHDRRHPHPRSPYFIE